MNYKEIIDAVLVNGVSKQATRFDANGVVIPVENGTIGTFCEIFQHDMAEGFPLTTLRKMPWKSIRVELEGFIQGITTKSWYKDRGCKFWNEWANPQEVEKHIYMQEFSYDESMTTEEANKEYNERRKAAQLETNDLGPVYGYQWRNFGKQYGETPEYEVDQFDCVNYANCNGVYDGVDQLQSIVDKLHSSPYDRRMVCSAWNPNQMGMMALAPCHWGFNVVVYGNKLNLIWHQRSVDLMLGAPANIASYGLLLMLLCEESGLEPGELIGTWADCHIYDNLVDNAKEIISRDEKTLPELKIKHKQDGAFDLFSWTHNEVELTGYDPHDAVNMGKVTV